MFVVKNVSELQSIKKAVKQKLRGERRRLMIGCGNHIEKLN